MASKFTICIKKGENGIGFAHITAYGIDNAKKTAIMTWGRDRIINIKA